MTTNMPARIWTANWSLIQIQELENQINLNLLERLQLKDIKGILLPLEKILADGAMDLWQCKTVSERQIQSKNVPKKPTNDGEATPRKNTKATKTSTVGGSLDGRNMTKEMRRRATIPIAMTAGTKMTTRFFSLLRLTHW